MKAEGADYKGILYCGIMMTARGPIVLEFNCRFGDPETQPIVMRLESDLLDAIEASIAGRVSEGDFRWSTSPPYVWFCLRADTLARSRTGKPITGIEEADRLPASKSFTPERTAATAPITLREDACWA